MRTFEEAESYVHSFTRFGSQLGLSRMRKLMHCMGDPQDRLRFVHVAGTNGKGTTVKLLASVMQRAGYRVGMYVSPFVVEFRERYQVNGEMIPKEEFAALVDEVDVHVQRLAAEGEQVTEFEMVTAVGFTYFARQGCELVVLEVGLGGRYDATNIIRTPECAVIASISLDHTAILGDTIEQIAGEKAGIIKENTDVVTYALQAPEALAVFYERCAETGSRLIQPNPAAVEILAYGAEGSRFVYGGESYALRLAGRHQIYNALSVIEAVKLLRGKGFSVTQEQLAAGLREAAFPARFELLRREPLVILDGAHNRQAAVALAQTLRTLDASPKVAVMGMMRDKDCRHAVEAVGRECAALLTVPVVGNPRAIPAEELAELARSVCPEAAAFPDYGSALARAMELAGKGGAVIVCGSFYMAADVRRLFRRPEEGEIYQSSKGTCSCFESHAI